MQHQGCKDFSPFLYPAQLPSTLLPPGGGWGAVRGGWLTQPEAESPPEGGFQEIEQPLNYLPFPNASTSVQEPSREGHGNTLDNAGPQIQMFPSGVWDKIPPLSDYNGHFETQPLSLPKGPAAGPQSAWHKVGAQ